MSWYTQWSDSIKKRACRYLLQRYLGQFLEEKLTLDQLSVDIYCGTGSVFNVGIDVQALNELGDEKNLPVEFVDGYVAEISVSIPWATLFTDSIYVEVSGLHITVQPKQRPDDACSMLESMWSSMASSIQLAAECLKHEATTVEGAEQDTETNMDGLEIFAHAIESILTRVKIKLINTSLRLEHVPKEGKNGIAFELKISNVEYCDETSCETYSSADGAGEPKQSSSFSIKKFHCEGVSFHTDEFPVDGRTFSRDVAQTKTKNLNCDKYVNETESIIIAKLFGLQEVRIKLKLDPAALGSKVDLEFNLGLLTLFLSPRQLYLLFEIFNSLASPHTQDTSNISSKRSLGEKLMSSRDFKKVEQELQDTLNFPIYSTNVPKLSQGRGWSSPSFDEGEDEYFLPMKLTNSLTGSIVSDKTTDTSFTSNTSLPYYSTKMDNMLSCETYSNLYGVGQKKVDKGCEADTHEETSSYHISLGGIVLILLTEDILTFGVDTSCLTPSSVSVMISHAKQFFEGISSLGFGSRSIYKDFGTTGGKSFIDASICSLNHVRLLATSVIIEGSDSGNMNNYIFSTTVSSASLEILECLVEKNTSANGKLQFVELLKFMRSNTEGNVKPHFQLTNQPDIRMHVQHIKKRQRSKLSSNLIVSLNLEQCWSELDLSIFDRITTITSPQTLCQVISTPREIMNQHSSFTQAVENTTLCDRAYVFNIKSPYFVVKFRFPIPDLRPIHEKGKLPEWQRSIRNDILYVNFIEPQFFTEIITKIPNQEYFISCNEILVLFQEGDINSAIPFIKATGLNTTSTTNQNLENKTETQVRFSLRLCPLQVVGDVEEFCEKEDNSGLSCSSFMDQPSKEPSPFISKKVIHETNAHDHSACEGEELIMPASKEDMQKFINSSQENSKIQVNITLPCLSVLFSTKHVYEVIYNRLTSDLSLWHSNGMNNLRNKSLSSQFDFSPLLQPSFSLCKSALQFESDESDEDETPSFKINQKGETSHNGQSYLSLNVHINKGTLNICPNVKDEKGNVCPEKYGGMLFVLQEGNIFSVTNYKGKPQQNYICFQVNNIGVHHKEEVDLPRSEYVLRMQTQSASQMRLDPVLVKSNKEVIATNLCPEGRGGNMFSTAISTSVNERKIKTIRVACSLSGATLRHRVAKHHQSWLSHLMDFFDVVDYPVKGYESPQFITEFYLHIWDSAIDYRPVNLPLRCVLTLGNLSISSNITRAKTSTLRFIAEEASLFISQKTRKGYNEESLPPNLRSDYISVVQLGLLELSLRLTDLPNMPKVDLKVSNNLVEIRTCADSATALAQLLRYYVSDGDLGVKVGNNEVKNKTNEEDKKNTDKSNEPNKDETGSSSAEALSDSTTERLHDMMEDAMREEISSLMHQSAKADTEIKNEDVEVFYFPDEGTQQSNPVDWGENNFSQDHDFCVLEHDANEGIKGEDGRPEIRLLTEEPVIIIDNHFSMCVGRTDSLLSPKYYPTPVSKYTLTDMTLIWHMYGGSDFSQTKKSVNFEQRENGNPNTTGLINYRTSNKDKDKDLPRSNTSNNTYFLDGNWSSVQQNRKRHSRFDKSSWQLAGGSDRKHSVLMQLQFNKVRFQHEIYPEKTTQASREVLLINEFEIRDRLSSSQINKFLYQYSSETNPRQSHANMVVIKAVHLRSDTQRNIQETCLKVSLLPLRLNIDQDSLQFLFTFFNQLSGLSITSEEDLGSALGTIHSSPVMGVTSAESTTEQMSNTMTEATTAEVSHTTTRVTRSPPLFIRNFIFSPEVPIRIDYEGKRVDLTHGPLAGLLMGLAQLNCLQIRLKRLSYKHGLLGLDRLISYALTEWVNDIKKTQFPNLLGGVGPMHALVQFFQGIRDLFWLPIEQYQKDGRIVRGLQRGANSFTTSTAIAALELTARIVQAIQSIAEAAFDMVSPGPSVRRSHGNRCKKQHCYSHPSDIREGVANAYTLVKEGLGETAETLVRVASAEAEQKGAVGAVGGVLRQLPPTVVAPIILATAATSNLIGGVHSQLAPDSRREATLKWRATPKS